MSRTQKEKVSCSTVWSQNMSRAPFTLAWGGVAVRFLPWVHLGSSHLGSIPALKQWKSVPALSLLGCHTLSYRLQNYIQLPPKEKKRNYEQPIAARHQTSTSIQEIFNPQNPNGDTTCLDMTDHMSLMSMMAEQSKRKRKRRLLLCSEKGEYKQRQNERVWERINKQTCMENERYDPKSQKAIRGGMEWRKHTTRSPQQ